MTIKLFILVLYFGVLFFIGWWSSKKIKDIKDYYVGGKKLGYWVVAFSTRATGESAWLLLGLTGLGAIVGISAFWVVLGEVIGVSLAWIFMAAFSALPYYFSTDFNYINSFFEAMSGITTTGASVVSDIESLSHGILFWRSYTQFIGGMGIIVFSIAILPLLGFGGVQLFKAEVAGPTADKLTPRIKQTAKYLWGIYLGLILVQTLVMWIEGWYFDIDKLNFFHALCHSFCTISTAGFSTYNSSIAAFESPIVTWTVIFFMFLSAINFTLHFLFFIKGSFGYLKNPEFKVYFRIIIGVSIFFFLSLLISSS